MAPVVITHRDRGITNTLGERDTMPIIASYLRCSTDEQAEASIPRQREAIEAYAKTKSIVISREYCDEGISGDRTEKRIAFHKLMKDAADGKIGTIIVFDGHRFGRFDSLESGYWLHPLRLRGVKIISVTEGLIDYSDFGSRIVAAVRAESGHDYLRKLGANATSGMARLAKTGRWAGGKPPFGYRRNADGFLVLGPTEEQELVRLAFKLYSQGESTRGIAAKLNADGVKPIRAKRWSQQTINAWLTCPIYAGDMVWNRRTASKYQSLRSGQVAAPVNAINKDGSPKRWKRHQNADWVTVENTHPAIVDKRLLVKVRRRMDENQKRTSPRRGAANPYLFSSMLRCAKCGSAMTGERAGGIERYSCVGNHTYGTCDRNSVRQVDLVAEVAGAIEKRFLTPEVIESVKAKLTDRIQQRRPKAGELAIKLQRVERKLETAAKRLLEIDADLLDVVQAEVRELRHQRDDLRDAVEVASKSIATLDRDIGKRVRESLESLRLLAESLKAGDTAATRELLRTLVERIEVESERTRINVRSKYALKRLVIHWRLSGMATIVHYFGQVALSPTVVERA